jgi:RNA polymerase sigma-70 factor (ECF subfamily)
LLVDHYRRGGSVKEVPADEVALDELGHAAPPEESSLGLDPDLDRALGALSDRERELLALRFGGDLTGPEIAETTELSLANVHQILSRALRKLREELGEEAPADDPAAEAGR